MRQIIVDRHLWLKTSQVNTQAIESALTWREATRDEPELVLYQYSSDREWIRVPRGYAKILSKLLDGEGDFEILEDRRPKSWRATGITSSIQLDHVRGPGGTLAPSGADLQRRAFSSLLSGRDGGLELYCGAGKTIIAAKYIAERNVPALVVVDNEPLLDQWRAVCQQVLKYRPSQEGLWKGSKEQWDRDLVFTTYQTLSRRAAAGLPDAVAKHFGVVIYDEGHHLGSDGFNIAASAFHGQRLNLSATPRRPDGSDLLTTWHIGPSLFTELRPPLSIEMTMLWSDSPERSNLPPLNKNEGVVVEQVLARCSAQASSIVARTEKVIQRLQERFRQGRRQLLLTRSLVAMANYLAAWHGDRPPFTQPMPADDPSVSQAIRKYVQRNNTAGALTAAVGREQFAEMGGRPFVVAILKFGREGYDQPALDTVMFDGPVGDPGLLQQALGRATRLYPDKPKPEAFTIVDNFPIHISMASKMTQMMRGWPEAKGGPIPFRKEFL